ncbi:unnamed protein product [Ostreobium quekettii]|uniref:Uncharacterized protein n=1 Tax=Ostreobium quekettii TaxID=121088 RepID=A0A8S1J3J4_9CHLO|nr:unnamed protein product [Ostreobium quekettii]
MWMQGDRIKYHALTPSTKVLHPHRNAAWDTCPNSMQPLCPHLETMRMAKLQGTVPAPMPTVSTHSYQVSVLTLKKSPKGVVMMMIWRTTVTTSTPTKILLVKMPLTKLYSSAILREFTSLKT